MGGFARVMRMDARQYSPQVEIRPEIGYYHSGGGSAFNNGTKNFALIGAGDLIWHF